MKELSRSRRISDHPSNHVFFLAVGVTVLLAVISISSSARGSHFPMATLQADSAENCAISHCTLDEGWVAEDANSGAGRVPLSSSDEG